jgi:glycosyltransferase involved in cell wall biosynthesis
VKVAIVNLTSGGLSGGYLKYLRALVPLLRQDARISRLDLFVPEGIVLDGCGPLHTWPARDGLASHRALRAQLDRLSPDVVFFPTARLLDCGDVPTMVMVRNMEPLTVPFGGNTWRESLRNIARARVARAACLRASRVIAVSRHVQQFVIGRWGLPQERVPVVYHGVDADGGGATVMPAALEGVPRFVFTAGSIRPARGLEDLIRAAPSLLRGDAAMRIAIAGKADRSAGAYEARMRRLAAGLGVANAIVWAGQLAPAEMAWGYDHCAAFVVTSRAEACPNVALEAMSHGAPIVSTSQDPMPEFFAGTAAYYRPQDAAGLAARIAEIVAESADEADRRRENTRARAAAFPWTRTAAETVAQLAVAAAMRGAR